MGASAVCCYPPLSAPPIINNVQACMLSRLDGKAEKWWSDNYLFANWIMVFAERISSYGCKWIPDSDSWESTAKAGTLCSCGWPVDNAMGINTYNIGMMIISTHCLVSCRECHSHEGRCSKEQTLFNVKDVKHEDCDVNSYQLIHSCIKRRRPVK